jgi:hypothetical protein
MKILQAKQQAKQPKKRFVQGGKDKICYCCGKKGHMRVMSAQTRTQSRKKIKQSWHQ